MPVTVEKLPLAEPAAVMYGTADLRDRPYTHTVFATLYLNGMAIPVQLPGGAELYLDPRRIVTQVAIWYLPERSPPRPESSR